MRVFLTHTDASFGLYFGRRALEALQGRAEVVRNGTGVVLQGEGLARAAARCEVVIADRATAGTAAAFAAAPDLLAFLRCAVDISTVDVAAASAYGILVTRATPGFTDAVAELGIGVMIALARNLTGAADASPSGPTRPQMGVQLSAATLGLVGFGRIPRRLAALAQAFGMTVLAHDPHAPADAPGVASVSLGHLLAQADFVVCLAAATPGTANLMDSRAFDRMKQGSRFINLARGELVDDAALEAALDSGRLAGAALDVGRAPDQMPSPRLARRPDVLATPHIGGLTRQAAEHQAMDTVRQVASLAAGTMPEGAANPASCHRLLRLWGRDDPGASLP